MSRLCLRLTAPGTARKQACNGSDATYRMSGACSPGLSLFLRARAEFQNGCIYLRSEIRRGGSNINAMDEPPRYRTELVGGPYLPPRTFVDRMQIRPLASRYFPFAIPTRYFSSLGRVARSNWFLVLLVTPWLRTHTFVERERFYFEQGSLITALLDEIRLQYYKDTVIT